MATSTKERDYTLVTFDTTSKPIDVLALIDTGAMVSVMPLKMLRCIGFSEADILPCPSKLSTYTGDHMTLHGVCKINTTCNGISNVVEFYIGDTDANLILSCNFSQSFELTQFSECCKVLESSGSVHNIGENDDDEVMRVCAPVTLSDMFCDKQKEVELLGTLDTGADLTAMPKAMLQYLGIPQTNLKPYSGSCETATDEAINISGILETHITCNGKTETVDIVVTESGHEFLLSNDFCHKFGIIQQADCCASWDTWMLRHSPPSRTSIWSRFTSYCSRLSTSWI